jgi:hypothetical protein
MEIHRPDVYARTIREAVPEKIGDLIMGDSPQQGAV